MSKVTEIIGKVIGGSGASIIDSVGKVVDEFTLSKEEKAAINQAIQNEVNRHEEALIDKANRELELGLADVQNARDNNARIQESDKASWWAKNTAYFLDIFLGLIWGSVTVLLIAKALKLVDNVNADMTAVLSIYSTVTALFMVSLNFHRSSSVGSKTKDSHIDKLINKK